jgi:AAA family ATP:ADP antiporter
MPNQDARSAYLGAFWAMVNGLAFLMQFVATPLLLRRLPLAALLVGIPVLHICTSGLMLSHPALWTAALALLLFKGLDYSVFRASKEILYIPLSFDARYRAKQVVDAFNYRFSKGAAAGIISLINGLGGALPGWAYPAASLLAAGSWALAALPLAGGGRGLSARAEAARAAGLALDP